MKTFQVATLCAMFCYFLAPVAARTPEAIARLIITRGIKAQGGSAQVARLKRVHIRVDGMAPGPSGGSIPVLLEDHWEWPGRYRTADQFTMNGQPVVRTLVINGDAGWAILNGKVESMKPAALQEMREEIYEESVDKLFPLQSPGYHLSLLGEASVDGRRTAGVRVASHGHRDVSLYFDAATGLLVKRTDHIRDDSGKDVLRDAIYADYKPFQGLKMATRLAAYYDGKLQFSGTVKSIDFRRKFPAAVFTRP